jgi:hypothetical protein
MRLPIPSKELKKRKTSLKRRQVDLNVLHPDVMSAVVGDFLDFKYPKKRLLKVVTSYQAAIQMQRVLPAPKPQLVNLIELLDVEDDSLKMYFVQRINAVRRVKELGKQVFFQLWTHIKDYCPNWRSDLPRVNQVFEFAETHDIHWEFSKKDVQAEIAYDLQVADPSMDWTTYLKKPCFHRTWSKAAAYPNHPINSKAAIIERIQEFQKTSCTSRKEQLTRVFKTNGVKMRSDSQFISSFIKGYTMCSPEEVCATLGLYSAMFEYSHVAWIRNHRFFEIELQTKFYSEGIDWIVAYREIINSPSFRRRCENKCVESFKGHEP